MSCWMFITGSIELSESRTWRYRIKNKIPPKEFFENMKYDILKSLGGISEDDFFSYKWYKDNYHMENYWPNPEPILLFEIGKFLHKYPDLIRKHNEKLDGSEGGVLYKIIPLNPASHSHNIKVIVNGSLRDRGKDEEDVIDFFKSYTDNLFKLHYLDGITVLDVNIIICSCSGKYIIQMEYNETGNVIYTLKDINNCNEIISKEVPSND